MKRFYVLLCLSLGANISSTLLSMTSSPDASAAHLSLEEDKGRASQAVVTTEEKYYSLVKSTILRQMFDYLGSTGFDVGDLADPGVGTAERIMDNRVYGRFVQVMRYLGGTVSYEQANADGFAEGAPNGVRGVGISDGHYNPNPNATFGDCIGANARTNITNLGNGNFQTGYTLLQEFTIANFPVLADALGNMATIQMIDPESDAITAPTVSMAGVVDGADDIHWGIVHGLSQFFLNTYTFLQKYRRTNSWQR